MNSPTAASAQVHHFACVEGVGPAAAAVALAHDTSPVGEQMRWAVALLVRAQRLVTDADLDRFVPAFLSKHPDGLGGLLRLWRDTGPYELESYEVVAHKSWATLTRLDGDPFTLSAVLDTNGLLRILMLTPERPMPLIAGWADLDHALTGPGITTSFLAARLRDGQWQTLHEMHPNRSMPSGST